MDKNPPAHSSIHVGRLILVTVTALSMAPTSAVTWARSANPQLVATVASSQPEAGSSSQSAAQQAPTAPDGDMAQMRVDLDRMESLLGNMSSEIEFLRDQNLQILLRTNAQMWRILISDLRRQVDRQERQRGQK